MDLATIQSLIAQGESETLELKRSTGQRSRIAEAACAMANSRGGSIVIGVLDDGGPAALGEVTDLRRQGQAAEVDRDHGVDALLEHGFQGTRVDQQRVGVAVDQDE